MFTIPIPKPLSQGKGLSVGLPPSPRLGLRPKQGCFGCLPKVLHDAKPAEQATLNTHFQKLYRFIDSLMCPPLRWAFQFVEKVCFFNKSACPQSLSPNPFPSERGYITGATAPRPCRGLRPCDPIFINDRGFSTVCNGRTCRPFTELISGGKV